MFYRMTAPAAAWDRVGTAAAAVVAGEIALAWTLVARSVRLGGGALALGAAIMIGSVIVLGRCRLPVAVKAALLLALTASVLGCMATQDALGARAIRAETDAALADAAAHTGDHIAVTAGAAGNPAAQALQGELADRGLAGDVTVALSPVDPAAASDPYRVHWTLERSAERVWCGEYTIADRKRPDVSLLADRVQDALAHSRGGPLTCD